MKCPKCGGVRFHMYEKAIVVQRFIKKGKKYVTSPPEVSDYMEEAEEAEIHCSKCDELIEYTNEISCEIGDAIWGGKKNV